MLRSYGRIKGHCFGKIYPDKKNKIDYFKLIKIFFTIFVTPDLVVTPDLEIWSNQSVTDMTSSSSTMNKIIESLRFNYRTFSNYLIKCQSIIKKQQLNFLKVATLNTSYHLYNFLLGYNKNI
uniref:Uncharacterized protein n=1 Tax=Rhizophagus irregularis (strain DAOM 181602 / DAOM 197198 / MUCL 43194) TaxID=747089 RepID=U9SNR8_RHIID